jgi:hypothetical protein
MLKKLLATVALIGALVASTTASADTGLPLTDPLIGNWCKVDVNAISPATYRRGAWTCDGSLLVEEDGYHDDGGYCTFSDVQRLPSKDGYTVRCSPGDREYSGKEVELRIISGRMRYRELAPTDCRKVGVGMSDGFLNLRAGPGMKYAVKAKLVTGDAIYVGEVTNGWARVSVPRFKANGEDFVGWVWNKHVVDNDAGCHVP